MPFPLLASVDGHAPIRSDPEAFVTSFVRKIEAGLLSGRPEPRSRYAVTRVERDRLSFRAADWKTAASVGLNEVDLSITPGRARYAIRYQRWAAFAIGLSGTVGVALLAFFVLFDLRESIERLPDPARLGMSVDQALVFALVMAMFWGLVWPWVLIALHRRPVRRLMERLIAEADDPAVRPIPRASR